FASGLDIYVGHTDPDGTSFSFTTLPVGEVTDDDISSVVAFGTSTNGHKIGVFWSDQAARRDWFAWRDDDDPIGAAWHIETAFGGGVGGCPTSRSSLCADDHMNLKPLGDDLYVAVKTSLNDPSSPNPADPLIALLHRDARGSWSSHRVSPVSQNATRPIVLLAPDLGAIWVFATKGSSVVAWQAELSDPDFDSNAFTTWTKSSAGSINDSTSTKQVITSSSGAVVETSQHNKATYFHNEFLP